MVFETEEAKIGAIEALGDDPANLSKLEEIRSAGIGTPEPESTPPERQPAAVATQEPAAPTIPTPDTFTVKRGELPDGYDSIGKVLKSFNEQKSLIERQTKFIKETLAQTQRTPQENDAAARAERAEAELARLRSSQPAQPQTTDNIATVQGEIARIEQLQAELDKQAELDPDIAWTSDYQKKVRELSRLQTKNLNTLTGLYHQAQTEIQSTRNVADSFVSKANQSKEEEAGKKARQGLYDEITGLDDPELKLSKKAEVVESEYVQWRADVALAYYGRPATSNQELFAALEQLQLKNPDLVSKCQLVGVSAEPTEDIKRYIQNCELIDYQNGYRKDPISGKWMRLMKADPVTGQQVPLILPSLKAAIQQKRIEEGYYERQRDGAFQKGAQSIADAASRRDKGAVELDTGSDVGQHVGDQKWAVDVLANSDTDQAMIDYRRGNTVKVDEINKARNLLGMDKITFEQG